MADDLNPIPHGTSREKLARQVRMEAIEVSLAHPTPASTNNGAVAAHLDGSGEDELIAPHDVFTKGLQHDGFGRVKRRHLRAFVHEINQEQNGVDYDETPFPTTYTGDYSGKAAPFKAQLYASNNTLENQPIWHRVPDKEGKTPKARNWESPISGHVFDLEGADAGKVAIPPAPELGSDELSAEMAEVYLAALLRDIPFSSWEDSSVGADYQKVQSAVGALNDLEYFKNPPADSEPAGRRLAARLRNGAALDATTLFRGSGPGAKDGPFVSQFLLIGNPAKSQPDPTYPRGPMLPEAVSDDALVRARAHGPVSLQTEITAADMGNGAYSTLIRYGIQAIPQEFRPHQQHIDHMTDWLTWLDVQNGANRKEALDFFLTDDAGIEETRLVATPRDLASYVHFDALYQAYLNACLILLGEGFDTDQGFPEGQGHLTRDAFATFGGPHILTLVTEVATRALKAVRRQKYNVHLRSRPEVLAAAISLAWKGGDTADKLGTTKAPLTTMSGELEQILEQINEHNSLSNEFWHNNGWEPDTGPLEDKNGLLPMAFPEGSPMHPAYGAGHATVAGACVTVLKAFFEMFEIGDTRGTFSIYDIIDMGNPQMADFPEWLFGEPAYLSGPKGKIPDSFVPDPTKGNKTLKPYMANVTPLTIEGELNKLAANISIGRNFAGVHYYTDYYESVRMGERIAISILQEQMLTYRDPVSMRLRTFDGDYMMLIGTGGSKGRNDTPVLIWDGKSKKRIDYHDWWTMHSG